MKTLSIGITTFSNRFEDVKRQISQIRTFDKNIEIILAVTNNYGEKFDEEYRQNILKLCSEYTRVYPLMFPRYTGLAKMWNNIVIHASSTHVLVMNDDIDITNPMIFNNLRIEIQKHNALRINYTFGHFIVSKEALHEIGYFDERLIAYGEEDGDFITRYKETFGKEITDIRIPGIANQVKNRQSDSYMTKMQTHKDAWGGNKPTINTTVMSMKKSAQWEDLQQYPYEKFINDNYDNIGDLKEIILR